MRATIFSVQAWSFVRLHLTQSAVDQTVSHHKKLTCHCKIGSQKLTPLNKQGPDRDIAVFAASSFLLNLLWVTVITHLEVLSIHSKKGD